VALQRASVTRESFHSEAALPRAEQGPGVRQQRGHRGRTAETSPSLPGLSGSPPAPSFSPARSPGAWGWKGRRGAALRQLPAHPAARPGPPRHRHHGQAPRSPSLTATGPAGKGAGSGPAEEEDGSSEGLRESPRAGKGREQRPEAVQAEALPAISCLYSEHSFSTE